jgi:hypothetical protein
VLDVAFDRGAELGIDDLKMRSTGGFEFTDRTTLSRTA